MWSRLSHPSTLYGNERYGMVLSAVHMEIRAEHYYGEAVCHICSKSSHASWNKHTSEWEKNSFVHTAMNLVSSHVFEPWVVHYFCYYFSSLGDTIFCCHPCTHEILYLDSYCSRSVPIRSNNKKDFNFSRVRIQVHTTKSFWHSNAFKHENSLEYSFNAYVGTFL